MGKISKRAKDCPLTKVKPKGKALKVKVIQKARDFMERFPTIFCLEYTNFKTTPFQQVRESLENTKILLGKAKILQLAAGKGPEDEPVASLHRLSPLLTGNTGLLFTDKPPEEIISFFESWHEEAYLHPGQVATEDVVIPAGIGSFKRLSHTAEPHVRKLGIPTQLTNGQIEVLTDYLVCRAGEELTPEKASILRLLDVKQGEMRITLKAYVQNGNYKSLLN